MNSFRIQPNTKRNLLYFFDAGEFKDNKPINLQKLTPKQKSEHGGLPYYHITISPLLYSIFSTLPYFFPPIISFKDKDGAIYHVFEKDLNKWIINQNYEFTGDYLKDIEKICKKNLLAHSTPSRIQSDHSKSNEALLLQHSNPKNNDSHIPMDMIDDIPPNNLCASVSPDLSQVSLLTSFKIELGGIDIYARPSLMKASGHYFSHFLDFAESTYSQSIIISLDDFEFEFFSKDEEENEIEREYRLTKTIHVIKNYLEGDREGDKIDNISPDFKVSPNDFYNLCCFHKIIDISGILEKAFHSINFYSNELLEWKGKKISMLAFYNELKNLCPDHEFIKSNYPKHQIINVLQTNLRNDLEKPTSCEFNIFFNKDASLNLHYKFKFDENYLLNTSQNSQHNYYFKYFAFLSDIANIQSLTDEQLQILNISSITIDLKEFRLVTRQINKLFAFSTFFIQLINEINNYIQPKIKNKIEFILSVGCHEFLIGQNKPHASFSDVLNELLSTYRKVSFNQIKIGMENTNNPLFLNKWQMTLSNLFNFLTVDRYSIEAIYIFMNNSVIFSSTLFPSTTPERKIEAAYFGEDFNISSHFSLINHPFHLVLNQRTRHLKEWNVIDLHKLQSINKLTIKHAELNSNFYLTLLTLCQNMQEKSKQFYCEFSGCKIEEDIQNDLDSLIEFNNEIYRRSISE